MQLFLRYLSLSSFKILESFQGFSVTSRGYPVELTLSSAGYDKLPSTNHRVHLRELLTRLGQHGDTIFSVSGRESYLLLFRINFLRTYVVQLLEVENHFNENRCLYVVNGLSPMDISRQLPTSGKIEARS